MVERPKLKLRPPAPIEPRPPAPNPGDCLIDCIAAADIYRRHLGLKWGQLVQFTPGNVHPYDLDRVGYLVLIGALAEEVGPNWVQPAPVAGGQLRLPLA